MSGAADGARALETCAVVLAELGQRLHARGQLPATSGNLSLRLGAASCAITASGADKGRLRAADVLAVDLAGAPLGAGKPSAETLLHTQLYARFPGVGAVLHTHASAAVLISRLAPQTAELRLRGYELQKALRGIADPETELRVPIFENDQDIARLAAQVSAHFERHPHELCWGYLIRSHGLYAWGADADEALRHHDALEYLLGCELELTRLRGLPGRHDAEASAS